eukprot:GEMP01150114.1.p1 GENE.GEMP01150114.1~~GEMP01150114.1.p1  ORF type:complete len:112 (-),score=5.83 GEMP01150114.1:9-344(-)
MVVLADVSFAGFFMLGDLPYFILQTYLFQDLHYFTTTQYKSKQVQPRECINLASNDLKNESKQTFLLSKWRTRYTTANRKNTTKYIELEQREPRVVLEYMQNTTTVAPLSV